MEHRDDAAYEAPLLEIIGKIEDLTLGPNIPCTSIADGICIDDA